MLCDRFTRRLALLVASAFLYWASLGVAQPPVDTVGGSRFVVDSTADPAPDATPKVEDVSADLDKIRAQHDLPGMVMAVLHQGRVVATGVAGVRQRGGEEKLSLNDRVHIGSCTKSMTATLVAILVHEKLLRWDMTLAQALPDLVTDDPAAMDSAYRGVTLEQLLCNRGGCPPTVEPQLWNRVWKEQSDPVASRRDFTQSILCKPPTQKPGEYAYSNAGFSIAGHIAECWAKKPYEALLQEKLLVPLGIQHAGFGAPGEGHPLGHRENGESVPRGVEGDNPVAISPAGRVHLPILEWGRYVQLHLSASADDNEKLLLPADALQRLQKRYRSDHPYARGWLRVPRGWAHGDALTHNGSNTYWYAVTWLAPSRNFAVLVACNQGGEAAAQACDAASGLGVARLPK